MDESSGTGGQPSRGRDYHHRFQTWFAWVFLGLAAVVGVWMFVGPEYGSRQTDAIVLLFAELPLFIILALIGMNALVRRGMGPKPQRFRRR